MLKFLPNVECLFEYTFHSSCQTVTIIKRRFMVALNTNSSYISSVNRLGPHVLLTIQFCTENKVGFMQIPKCLVCLSMYFLFQPPFTISHRLWKSDRHALPHRILRYVISAMFNNYINK